MNTQPDEYHCACPEGFSGKNCEIGERESTPQRWAFHVQHIFCPLLRCCRRLLSQLYWPLFCQSEIHGTFSVNLFTVCRESIQQDKWRLVFLFFFFKNRKKIPKHISYEINVSLSSTLLLLQLSTPVFPVLVQMVVHAARFQQGLNASVLQAGITQPVPVSVFISFLHMKVISSHENQVFDQSVTYLSIFLRFG